jgi:endonuclease/exonuclease/phosphatase family metal-dependent hydrolase
VVVSHQIVTSALPNLPDSLSILSYNILLPNSVDAWWTYKMYSPPLSVENREISSWTYRRNLLQDRIGQINADVVCLQEVSPESFEDDFSFMADLGYDECELFRKGRFRPATFWKGSKCTLVTPAAHKDRTLLTAFRCKVDDQEVHDKSPIWFVLNCHLQAGREGQRRVRQVIEGTKAIVTMAKKLKVPNPTSQALVIICGDFNGGSECGAVRLLEDGTIDTNFREDGDQIVMNAKQLAFVPPLLDAMTFLDRTPPPTMVVTELISQLVQDGNNGYEDPKLSSMVRDRLTRIFYARASLRDQDKVIMSRKDVEEWLIQINGSIGRGDEFREAARQMGWQPSLQKDVIVSNDEKQQITLPTDGVLDLEGFIAVYQNELSRGKFWGISHDLAILGEPLEDLGLFAARYDRMYCSASLQPISILDFPCQKPCPNSEEPSDHLPVTACFVPKTNKAT